MAHFLEKFFFLVRVPPAAAALYNVPHLIGPFFSIFLSDTFFIWCIGWVPSFWGRHVVLGIVFIHSNSHDEIKWLYWQISIFKFQRQYLYRKKRLSYVKPLFSKYKFLRCLHNNFKLKQWWAYAFRSMFILDAATKSQKDHKLFSATYSLWSKKICI